jgi:hypothetical protein
VPGGGGRGTGKGGGVGRVEGEGEGGEIVFTQSVLSASSPYSFICQPSS